MIDVNLLFFPSLFYSAGRVDNPKSNASTFPGKYYALNMMPKFKVNPRDIENRMPDLTVLDVHNASCNDLASCMEALSWAGSNTVASGHSCSTTPAHASLPEVILEDLCNLSFCLPVLNVTNWHTRRRISYFSTNLMRRVRNVGLPDENNPPHIPKSWTKCCRIFFVPMSVFSLSSHKHLPTILMIVLDRLFL